MFKPALIAGAAILLGVAALSFFGPADHDDRTSQPSENTGVTRHAFLDGLELGVDGNGYALILHPMATGDDMRVVTDPAALKAAQGKAYYTDDPGEQTKVLMLSILFLSPPGMPPDSQFVTVTRNKEIVEHFRCYVPFCTGTFEADPPHERDLAGLLEASRPVERVFDTYLNPEDTRAAHFRALKDPAVVQIDPPKLPPPNTVVFPKRLILSLPPVLLDTDDSGNEPLEPFDEAEYTARFTAAFTHAYPQTEAYRLGEMQFSTAFPPLYGWPVVSDHFEGYLRDDADQIRGIKHLMMKEPTISINLTPTLATTLLDPDPFSAMPEFAREPDSLSERLDALALEVLGTPCPDCFKIELPLATVDDIHVYEVQPTTYPLSYLRITSP